MPRSNLILTHVHYAGSWDGLIVAFHVQREIMHHIMQTYIPSALIVIISWFSFWLDIDTASERVSLNIATLLTTITQVERL